MILALILDGIHEGHLLNLDGPRPTVRMTNPLPTLSGQSAISEGSFPNTTPLKASEYKAVFQSSEYAANCKSCALIARLEAAEKAMDHFSTETVLNDCCHPYLTAWHKAAGK